MLMKIDFLCLQLDCMDQKDPVLEEEVKYRYYTVIQLYRRSYLQDNAQRYLIFLSLAVTMGGNSYPAIGDGFIVVHIVCCLKNRKKLPIT